MAPAPAGLGEAHEAERQRGGRDQKKADERDAGDRRPARRPPGRSGVGPRDGGLDGVQPGRDPLSQPALPESRRHHVADDRGGDRVGQGRLEAVADLEAHLPVVEEDHEDDAVVEPLPADPPRLGQADRELLEALAAERAEDGDDDLVRALALAGGQPRLEPVALGRGEGPRVVVDAPGGGGRNGELGEGNGRGHQAGDREERDGPTD